MMTARKASLTLLSALACAVAAHAQTSTTSGSLRGALKNRKGAAQVASVTVRNLETGFSRTVTADAKGEYAFLYLPIGPYEVTATAPGMRAAKDSRIQVALGQTATLNFTMDAAEASAVVEVTAETTSVDVSQINTQTAVGQELIAAIPLVSRNFTDLVQLTPGAATNAEGYRTAVEGARGIQNNLQIDGASFNSKFSSEQRGGTRVPFSFGVDSIKELQVITNSFDAQFGDSVGAVINAVTKTGTNQPAGMAFIMFKPSSLVAKVKPVPYDPKGSTNTEAARTRDYQQSQMGFNYGGPIIKDKLHYFLNVEMARLREESVPSFGWSNTSTGNTQTDYNAFFGAGAMGSLLTAMPGRSLLQESTTPWTDQQTNLVVMGRLDWTVNADHRATLRINSQNYEGLNDIYAGQRRYDTAESGESTMKFKSLSIVAELNSILSPNLINEARFQNSVEDRPTTPNSTLSAPVRIASIGGTYTINAGQYYIDPRTTKEITNQFQDNLTYIVGDWTFKGGVDLQHIRMKNRFLQAGRGNWGFTTYAAANQWFAGTINGTGVSYSQGVSPVNGFIDFSEKYFASYIQSQYTGLLDRRLMLSLGVRTSSERWTGNPNPNPKLQGLDHQPDDSAVDPRFGFSLDLFGNNRTVIRGGYGWFSISNPGQTASGGIMNNGINLVSYSASSASYPALFAFGGVLSAAERWSGASLTQPGGLTPLTATEIATLPKDVVTATIIDPKAKMSQARSAALGIEHDLGNGYTLGAKATVKKFLNLQYAVNINLRQYADGSTTVLSSDIYNDGYATTWNKFSNSTANRPYRAIVRGRQLDLSGFGDVILSKYDGEGKYRSLVLEVKREVPGSWGFRASATFAKAEDNNSNERATLTSTNALTENPANPLQSFAYSDNDRKYRAVIAWWAPRVFGVRVSGLYTYTTGRPYSGVYYDDINGDGKYIDTATGRNAFRQPGSKTFDLRIERGFRVTRGLRLEGIVDVFNVFNWANQYTAQTYYANNPGTIGDGYQATFGKLDRPDSRTREVQFTLKAKF